MTSCPPAATTASSRVALASSLISKVPLTVTFPLEAKELAPSRETYPLTVISFPLKVKVAFLESFAAPSMTRSPSTMTVPSPLMTTIAPSWRVRVAPSLMTSCPEMVISPPLTTVTLPSTVTFWLGDATIELDASMTVPSIRGRVCQVVLIS